MLRITVPAIELWDEQRQEFIHVKEQTLTLEHSLVSLSKWESKWCKPFLSAESKTEEEIADYIQCMTLTQNVDPKVYKYLTVENIQQVNEYIGAPMTATKFYNYNQGSPNREKITAELIYYWMIALNVPFECQKWHLNRLMALIRMCEVKNRPPKKMSRREVMQRNNSINAARRKKYHTKG